MPEPVSTIGLYCLAGYAALDVYARGGSAISSEARRAQQAATAVIGLAERSQVLFGKKTAAMSQLMAIANECAAVGWDGNEASAIDEVAVLKAQEFVRAMPDEMPLPEFAPEPDGSVSLDWIQSRYRLFSLSIGKSDRLAFVWLDGTDSGHGVARFDGKNVPLRVLDGIRAIMNHGTAYLRAA